jgi:hypothetical protein
MTRGTLYYITDHNVYRSCEFNGDMYPEGHGRFAIELLSRVTTTQKFYDVISLFNRLCHDYSDDYPLVRVSSRKDLVTDFNDEYFEHYFSDWVFIKNGGKTDIEFTYRPEISDTDEVQTAKKETLKPGEYLVSNFGCVPSLSDLNLLDLKEDKS